MRLLVQQERFYKVHANIRLQLPLSAPNGRAVAVPLRDAMFCSMLCLIGWNLVTPRRDLNWQRQLGNCNPCSRAVYLGAGFEKLLYSRRKVRPAARQGFIFARAV